CEAPRPCMPTRGNGSTPCTATIARCCRRPSIAWRAGTATPLNTARPWVLERSVGSRKGPFRSQARAARPCASPAPRKTSPRARRRISNCSDQIVAPRSGNSINLALLDLPPLVGPSAPGAPRAGLASGGQPLLPLWLTTGMATKEWVSVHRKHHARSDSAENPHSPQIHGIRKVLLPAIRFEPAKTRCDMDTLRSVITHRHAVLAQFDKCATHAVSG